MILLLTMETAPGWEAGLVRPGWRLRQHNTSSLDMALALALALALADDHIRFIVKLCTQKVSH